MKSIHKIILAAFCSLVVLNPESAKAQTLEALNLERCYDLAQANYPLIAEYELVEKTTGFSLDNISKSILPKIHLGGQASYQSEVVQFPFSIPNMELPTIDKDQYKLYLDVSQPITDFFTTVKHQKELVNAEKNVKIKSLDAAMYQIKERINQLYFGILLVDEQIAQIEILRKNIQSGMERNRVSIQNGIALRSSADVLQAELLKTDKRIIQLQANRKAFTEILSLFIGQNIDENTILVRPNEIALNTEINRPELAVFQAQKQIYESREKLIDDKSLPRFILFGQGGYGRPGLNMLSNDFDLFYIAGLRLSWDITSFYTKKNEKQKLSLQQQSVAAEENTFLFNTRLAMENHSGEIEKLDALIEVDQNIIQLREKVRLTAQNQLENGVITVNDYLRYVNDEDEARQGLIVQKMKRLIAHYEHQNTTGN